MRTATVVLLLIVIPFSATAQIGGRASQGIYRSGGGIVDGPPGDGSAPVISAVASGSLTATSGTITWTTDEAADSQVEYGLTTGYGTSTALDATMVMSHSVVVSGLSASTLYHYRVKSKDAANNQATGSDNTFTTSSDGSPPSGWALPALDPDSPAELPREYLNTDYPDTSDFTTLRVVTGGTLATGVGDYPPTMTGLQNAINYASANASETQGFQIRVEVGLTLSASTGITYKRQAVNNRWIIIRPDSTAWDAGGSMPPGVDTTLNRTKARPANVSSMFHLVQTGAGGNAIIDTEFVNGTKGASFYRIVGAEMSPSSTGPIQVSAMVRLGNAAGTVDTPGEIASDLIIDRCYIHGTPLSFISQAVYIASNRTAIIDSTIQDVYGWQTESKAITILTSQGPLKIHNNTLEGLGITLLCGGARPAFVGINTGDVQLTRNYCFKNTRWKTAIISATSSISSALASGGSLSTSLTYTYKIAGAGPIGDLSFAYGKTSTTTAQIPTNGNQSVTLTYNKISYPDGWANATRARVWRSTNGGSTWAFFDQTISDPSATTQTFTDNGSQVFTSGTPDDVGMRMTCKNLFELKWGKRWLIDSNIFEYAWSPDQSGHVALFKSQLDDTSPEGRSPHTTDITYTNNIGRHAGHGFVITRLQAPDGGNTVGATQSTERVFFKNILYYDISSDWGATGPASAQMGLLGNNENVTFTSNWKFSHCTLLNAVNKGPGISFISPPDNGVIAGLTLKDSITFHGGDGLYTFKGSGLNDGDSTISVRLSSPIWDHNTMANTIGANFTAEGTTNKYPADHTGIGFSNYTAGVTNDTLSGFALTAGSTYSATGASPASDGTDRGCNITLLQQRLSGVAK
jgi:Purple acid Phosphatase, N-terminal domain